MALRRTEFERWLSAYGKAWEEKNPAALANLFAEGGLNYTTPFSAPQRGREEIRAAAAEWLADRDEIQFGARVLYVEARLGAAHWSAALARKGAREHLDGILVVQIDESGKALSLRKWWHTDER